MPLAHCPLCDTKPVPVRGEVVTFVASDFACPVCGEALDLGPRLLDQRLRRTYAMYRARHGLLTPHSIRRLRLALGLSRRALARALDWSWIAPDPGGGRSAARLVSHATPRPGLGQCRTTLRKGRFVMTRSRPRRVKPSLAVREHLRRVLPRAMPVPPSRSHRPAKGPGSYRRRPKHPRVTGCASAN